MLFADHYYIVLGRRKMRSFVADSRDLFPPPDSPG